MWTRFLDLLAWIVAHPMQLLGVLAIVWALALAIGAAVYAIWSASEERKAVEQAERFKRIMLAQRHDGPRTPPRAPGYPTRRVG